MTTDKQFSLYETKEPRMNSRCVYHTYWEEQRSLLQRLTSAVVTVCECELFFSVFVFF